jgi:hypothetical protein
MTKEAFESEDGEGKLFVGDGGCAANGIVVARSVEIR